MRDILIRGKRLDNGKWAQGCLLYDEEQTESYIAEYFEDKSAYIRNVDPDTVGQYTGLTDKNGKKIFEGDIFLYDNETTYLVKWDYEYYGFYAEADEDYNDYDVLGNFYSNLCEVIGNIHDNPELLKGAKDDA